jgi:hypothetical protein
MYFLSKPACESAPTPNRDARSKILDYWTPGFKRVLTLRNTSEEFNAIQ